MFLNYKNEYIAVSDTYNIPLSSLSSSGLDDLQVTNHGIPDSLIGSVTSWLSRFFHQTDEEKQRYAKNDPTDRIRFVLGGVTKRELLHMRTHPTFHCPTKPDDPM